MALVVGVDSSTQSTKVELRDADSGALVDSRRAPHPPTSPPRSEQDPDAWWSALAPLLRDDVAAMSIAAQQHGMVVLDRDGSVIRPAKLWNDTESATDAAELVDRLGGPSWWAHSCGSVPTAAFTVTKLAWLRRVEPQHADAVASVLLPHDWLTYRLTGARVTDRGDASGTGYWSPRDERWLPEVLDAVGFRLEIAPDVLAPSQPAGQWGQVVVGPGTGDNMAAALGLGLLPGDVAISLGTSGTVFTVSEVATADPTGAVAGFADATGRRLPLVCTLNCTKVTDRFRDLLGVTTAEFDALALQAAPGADGLTLIPYLDGERTPNRPRATGRLVGLRSTVTRAAIARAAVEGVVSGLLDGLDAIRRAGVDVDSGRVFLTGGGARSAIYQRVVTDLLGRPVVVASADEHSALGAAVQAAMTLTGASAEAIIDAWRLGNGEVVEPDPRVDREAIRTRYRKLAAIDHPEELAGT
jgi:xylulokinase